MEASSLMKVLAMAGGENWKRNLNHAAHQGWISPADKMELERVRQSNALGGQSLRKQAQAIDPPKPCFKSKTEERYGSKGEMEKHLSQHRKEKDSRHKEEKDRRQKEEKDRTHKEETDRRGELKRKREALEKEEQELMEEERRKEEEEEEEKEREKEREKLMKWEIEMMEHEDLQGALMLLDEELEAEKQRPKKMKKEKEEEKQKAPSPMNQLVQMFKDSWSALGDAEVTGVKMKMTT